MAGTEIAEDGSVKLNGFEVPHIQAWKQEDGTVNLIVDGRFGIHRMASMEELQNFLPILANAVAVAAGWSCHGENRRRLDKPA